MDIQNIKTSRMERNPTKLLAGESCNLPLEKLRWEDEEGNPESAGSGSLARTLLFTL